MQIQNFDATGIPPQQMGDRHPVGDFPFQISNTYGQENKSKDGGMLVVQFTTPAGTILNYYNLFNKNDQAREIAHKELSALCHATGIFRLSFADPQNNPLPMDQWARELRGGRGVVKVGLQDVNKPDGYVEVKKIFDSAGNEPGKTGGAANPQPQGQSQQGSWGNQTQQQQPQGNGGWNSNQQQNQQPQQPNPGQGGGNWSSGPNMSQQAQQQQPGNTGGTGGAAKPPWLS